MRAYQIKEFGIDKLEEVDLEMPELGDEEVLVRVYAVSLNYRDVMVVSGTYNPKMRLPAIPFSDAAGEIVAVGRDVKGWSRGDKVCSHLVSKWIDGRPTAEITRSAIGAGRHDGVLREYAVFHEDALVRMPLHLNYSEASTLPCAAVTAWNALMVAGGLRSGETVLTLGTGGVSMFAIQLARLAGVRVIATSSSDEKLEQLRRFDVDVTINYRDTPEWAAAVLEATNGAGVDHVIEVGGAGTLEQSIKAVKVGGHIALIGALSAEGSFNPVPIFMKALRVSGIFIGSRAMFESLNAAVNEVKLKPVIDREFGFGEVREALHYMASGKHFGKVVVRL